PSAFTVSACAIESVNGGACATSCHLRRRIFARAAAYSSHERSGVFPSRNVIFAKGESFLRCELQAARGMPHTRGSGFPVAMCDGAAVQWGRARHASMAPLV